jgi:DNA polymerase I
MKTTPTRADASKLMLRGAQMLSRMERNGIRIDTGYLDVTIKATKNRIQDLEAKIKASKEFKVWVRRFGEKTKLDSRSQLGTVVFDCLGYTRPDRKTCSGADASDEATFQDVDSEFVKDYFEVQGLKKALGTYLNGIAREVVDGYLHPFFNLHTVRSYRSSSNEPNFQNIPVRDPVVAKLIRPCFIPRKGRRLLEIDYGMLEFRVAACFWKDPAMVRYASDPKADVHSDKAEVLFLCTKEQVARKTMRHVSKNRFVFPILYGSYYVQCAMNIWEEINRAKMTLADGKTLVTDHLKAKGIKGLGACDPKGKPRPGTFEYVVQQAEREFNDGFPVFQAGKETWLRKYQKRGYFDTMTGFRVSGHFSRNDLMNYPIQGPGFHCLLWSLCEIQDWLDAYDMATLPVGQIHDCGLLDAPENEIEDVLESCHYFMTRKLRKHWDWVVTPMDVEADVTPAGGSWHDKAPWVRTAPGEWSAKA